MSLLIWIKVQADLHCYSFVPILPFILNDSFLGHFRYDQRRWLNWANWLQINSESSSQRQHPMTGEILWSINPKTTPTQFCSFLLYIEVKDKPFGLSSGQSFQCDFPISTWRILKLDFIILSWQCLNLDKNLSQPYIYFCNIYPHRILRTYTNQNSEIANSWFLGK